MSSKAIIFDLDGTLWNAVPSFKNVYDKMMKERNEKIIYSLKDFENIMGSTPKEVIERICGDSGWTKEDAIVFFKDFYLEVLKDMLVHPPFIYEQEEETLKVLSTQYDLYIVSNSSPNYVETYFITSKLQHYFKGYLQAGDTHLDKAENIIKLMNDYHINEAIYVGDTNKDLLAAEKAGIDLIFASYGFGRVEKYKFKLEKISDLIKIKDQIFA